MVVEVFGKLCVVAVFSVYMFMSVIYVCMGSICSVRVAWVAIVSLVCVCACVHAWVCPPAPRRFTCTGF